MIEQKHLAQIAALSPEKRALLEKKLQNRLSSALTPPTDGIPARAADAAPIPSLQQKYLWFRAQLDPTDATHHRPLAIDLKGTVDVPALARALDQVVQRHEALRTRFFARDGVINAVIEPTLVLPLAVQDLSDMADQDQQHVALIDSLLTHSALPFDLTTDALMRVRLYRLQSDHYVLLVVVHHLIFDGWSARLFLEDLLTFYDAQVTGKLNELSPLPITYADYAQWQSQQALQPAFQQQINYWTTQLTPLPNPLDLPADRPPRPNTPRQLAVQSLPLPADLVDALRSMGAAHAVTLHQVMLATYAVLLMRYSRQTDFVIGSLVAGRPSSALQRLIGFFVNILPIRFDLSGNPTFAEFLGRVRQAAQAALSHSDPPEGALIERLHPPRHHGVGTLFHTVFNFESLLVAQRWTGDTLTAAELHFPHVTQAHDLSIEVIEDDGHYTCDFKYDAARFDESTIQRCIGHYLTLLASVVRLPQEHIGRLPMMTDAERHTLLVEWNNTQKPYPRDARVVDLFEAQVIRTPDALAVIDGEARFSLRAVDQRANGIAMQLIEAGLVTGQNVGVLMPRSADAVATVLAIWKAGGVYVPLDPGYPAERIRYMIQDCAAPLIITQTALARQFALEHPIFIDSTRSAESPPMCQRSPADAAAFIIYTSGSTGRPKGVIGTGRSIVANLFATWNAYPIRADEVIAQKTALNFVDSLWEMFGTLLSGNPMMIIPDADLRDPARLVALLAREQIMRIWLVPSLIRVILEIPDLRQRLPQLRDWVSTGEALPVDLVKTFRRVLPDAHLYNLYGTSEAWNSFWHQVTQVPAEGAPVPIGTPADNVMVTIVDDDLQPVPIGIPGEIVLGGDNVGLGYLNRPEITVERFRADPMRPDQRLYRTGDLGRWLSSGIVEYLGRIDQQVKVRGFRIDLGEVESALASHVRQAVVTSWQPPHGNVQIIAYILPHDQHPQPTERLRDQLATLLPDFMIPAHFIELTDFPLTPSGKIDRKALPAPTLPRSLPNQRPPTWLENRLITIWQDVLHVPALGLEDDFFDMGGHSLLILQLLARIEKELGGTLAPAQLFESPTITGMAAHLQKQKTRWSLLLPLRSSGTKPALFCIHGIGGGAFFYRPLALLMNDDQPVYGLMAQGMDEITPPHGTIREMAQAYVAAIKTVQPQGPYFLTGYSLGAGIALEMAIQLRQSGDTVALLALIDPPLYENLALRRLNGVWRRGLTRARNITRALSRRTLIRTGTTPDEVFRLALRQHLETIHRHYVPGTYPQSTYLLVGRWRREKGSAYLEKYLAQWQKTTAQHLTIMDVPGRDHAQVMDSENLSLLATLLTELLAETTKPEAKRG